MELQSSNFSILKSKIIKTDELLRNYSEKSNKLSKSQKALKELRGKCEHLNSEVDRLKLENERLSFSFNTIKPKYEELVGTEKNLKLQLTELQEKYNEQAIETQLKFQELEENSKNSQQSVKWARRKSNSKNDGDEIARLEKLYNEKVLLVERAEKQFSELQEKNRQTINELEKQKKHHDCIINRYKMENNRLAKEIGILQGKVKSLESHQAEASQQKQKDAKIQELYKRIAALNVQKEELHRLKNENESLQVNLNKLLSKSVKNDAEVQTEESNLSIGIDAKEIKENLELENGFLSTIFNEMIVPGALSPMNFLADDDESVDSIIDQIPAANIPKIIITPPTPNDESCHKHFTSFSDKLGTTTVSISTQTNILSQDISTQTSPKEKSKSPQKKLVSILTQTDAVKNIGTAEVEMQTNILLRNIYTQTSPKQKNKLPQKKLFSIPTQTDAVKNIETAKVLMQRNILLQDIYTQTSPKQKNKLPQKKLVSILTQTDAVKNIETAEVEIQTEENIMENRRNMKFSQRMRQNMRKRSAKKIKQCLCKNDGTNIIIKAIKLLTDNNISVNISNNNTVVPKFQQQNFINSLNIPKYIKIEDNKFEKMTCFGKSCDVSDYKMVLDAEECLLGFLNVKEEVPSPPVSRLNNRVEDPKKNTERPKRKWKTSSEFCSEAETEVERCFERKKKKKKPDTFGKKKKFLKHNEKSDSDSDVSSIKETSDIELSQDVSLDKNMEKHTSTPCDSPRITPDRTLPVNLPEKNIKKSSCRKIMFTNNSPTAKRSSPRHRKYSTDSPKTFEESLNGNSCRVISNPILISPEKVNINLKRTPKRNERRFSSESTATICKITPNPSLLSPLSEISEKVSPDVKDRVENDFKSLVDDMDLPEEMLSNKNGEENEIVMDTQLDDCCNSDVQSSVQANKKYISDFDINKLEDPPDFPNIENKEDEAMSHIKRKRGRPRKVTKLMSNALKLAKTRGSMYMYKDASFCDPVNSSKFSPHTTNDRKEIEPNKKIRIVQNIVIPPAHRVPISRCDNFVNIKEGTTDQAGSSANLNPPKKKGNFKKPNKGRFAQHTNSDITSQIIQQMMKTRMNSFTTPKPNEVGKQACSPIKIEQLQKAIPKPLNLDIEKNANAEDKNEDVLECPASPDAVELPYCSPKLIPTVNIKHKHPMQGSKITVLFDKLIMYSTEEHVLDEVASEFLNETVDFVARIVLEKVSVDIHEKAENKHPPAPVLTNVQRVLLGFMACLERKNMPTIFDRFLEKAEKALLDKRELQMYGLQAIEPITRMYTAVCKLKKNVNRMRRFCSEAFYFMKDFAVPLFFCALTIWSEILPMAAESAGFPLARVLVQLCFVKDCNTPGYNLLPLRDLLHKYFGYPNERRDPDEVFNEVLIEYYKNPSSRLNVLSVLVYCKNQPTNWVYRKIKEYFIPLVYKVPAENVNLRATVIILTANLCNAFDATEDDAVIKEMERWYRSLDEDASDVIVKNAVYYSVVNLPKKTKSAVGAEKDV